MKQKTKKTKSPKKALKSQTISAASTKSNYSIASPFQYNFYNPLSKGDQVDPKEGLIIPDSTLINRSEYITTRSKQNHGFWPGQLEITYQGHEFPFSSTASLITAPCQEKGDNYGKAWCITCAHNFTKIEHVGKEVNLHDAVSGKLYLRRTQNDTPYQCMVIMDSVTIYPKYFKNNNSSEISAEEDIALFAINWQYEWDNSGKPPSALSFKGINEITQDTIIKIDGYPGYYPDSQENHAPYGKQGSVQKVQYFKQGDGENSGLITQKNLMTLPGMAGSVVRVKRDHGQINFHKAIGKSNQILYNEDIGRQQGKRVVAEITAIHIGYSDHQNANIACLLTPQKLRWIWEVTGAQMKDAPDYFEEDNWYKKYKKEKNPTVCQNICSIF